MGLSAFNRHLPPRIEKIPAIFRSGREIARQGFGCGLICAGVS